MRAAHLELSERRAGGLAGLGRSIYRYRLRKSDQSGLRERLKKLAAERRRYGYRRLTVLLKRAGEVVNHKRVYRLYREEGLSVRRRKRKRIGAVERQPLAIPTQTNQRWSMDFVADGLGDGRKFRSLNIVDDYSRECVAAEVDTSKFWGSRSIPLPDRLYVAAGTGEKLPNRLSLTVLPTCCPCASRAVAVQFGPETPSLVPSAAM